MEKILQFIKTHDDDLFFLFEFILFFLAVFVWKEYVVELLLAIIWTDLLKIKSLIKKMSNKQ